VQKRYLIQGENGCKWWHSALSFNQEIRYFIKFNRLFIVITILRSFKTAPRSVAILVHILLHNKLRELLCIIAAGQRTCLFVNEDTLSLNFIFSSMRFNAFNTNSINYLIVFFKSLLTSLFSSALSLQY